MFALELAIRYIHFISIFILVSSLAIELVLIKSSMTKKELLLMSRVDAVYGISSILVVAAGLTLWFGVGKPAHYYSDNHLFITKVVLVGLLGILSIKPTIFFLKNRKKKDDSGEEMVVVPTSVKRFVYAEILVVVLIPLFAVLMARGVGL
ncbi:MAG: DUF2214 family protein [Bacteroidetes bacterium]|nr:DUF2214 family protein [Bacteroidota bacterium]